MAKDGILWKKLSFFSGDRAKAAGVALLLLASTSAGFAGGWLGASSRDHQAGIEDAREISINESEVINKIAEEVGKSVVSINVISQNGRSFFGGSLAQASAGTGFIISEDGVVVTNRHVVPSGTSEVSVTLSDGTELDDISVIGRTGPDDPLDIAFLKINDTQGQDLRPVVLGNSSDMEVGNKVVAIGNALGQFQNTVTTGIISGYGRNVQAVDGNSTNNLQNLFQTDAAINEGNSGGPLVNIDGQVIGVTTAVAGGGAENIGFAIPIDDIKGLIASVLEEGELLRPYLGVRYIQLNEGLAEEFNVSITNGAYIVPSEEGAAPSIFPDSPAAEAGLREGDVITKVNDQPVNEDNSLTSLIGRHQVGDEVSLTIVRDGQEQEVKVTLEALPE